MAAITPLKQVRFAVKNIFHSPPTSPSARHATFSFGGAAAAMSLSAVAPSKAIYGPQIPPSSAPPTRSAFYYPHQHQHQHALAPYTHAPQLHPQLQQYLQVQNHPGVMQKMAYHPTFAHSHRAGSNGSVFPTGTSPAPAAFHPQTMTSSSSALRAPTPTSILKQPRAAHPSSHTTSSSAAAQPHPLLGQQLVEYDLRDHPSVGLTYRAYPLSNTTLSEPATTPPVPFLTLKCVYLPRLIKVYASNGLFITLSDLFCTLYNTLRTNLTEADFYAIPSGSDKKRTLRAYEKRYRRLRDGRAYDQEKMGGLKVVDLLLEHTEFAGLSLRGGGGGQKSDEWYLHVR